jgi:uncharacterized protein (TIGR03084 family)
MKNICNDLTMEQEELETIVSGLDEKQWLMQTACDLWTIKDEIIHLAYFDDRAAFAARDPEGFSQHLKEDIGRDFSGMAAHIENASAGKSTGEILQWWKEQRSILLEELGKLHSKDRLPWYGPPMSALSFATARLMETWAHGQDIYDVLKIERTNTDRLRHIAHLGVRTLGWSYMNRGLVMPEEDVRVELKAPSGEIWEWGPENCENKITGPAEDFCLIVVQRRHVADTRLIVEGKVAKEWMLIAQCFAGLASEGPEPGTLP